MLIKFKVIEFFFIELANHLVCFFFYVNHFYYFSFDFIVGLFKTFSLHFMCFLYLQLISIMPVFTQHLLFTNLFSYLHFCCGFFSF